jgi:hypothetical protein
MSRLSSDDSCLLKPSTPPQFQVPSIISIINTFHQDGTSSFQQPQNKNQKTRTTQQLKMLNIESIPHTDCSVQHGPGQRSRECGICKEEKETDQKTICHTVCLNSFHEECFVDWSKACSNRQSTVTCPVCRAVLAPVPLAQTQPSAERRFHDVFEIHPSDNNYLPLRYEIPEEFFRPHMRRLLVRAEGRSGYLHAEDVTMGLLDTGSRERLRQQINEYGVTRYFGFMPSRRFCNGRALEQGVALLLLPDFSVVRSGSPWRTPPANPAPPLWFRQLSQDAQLRALGGNPRDPRRAAARRQGC